MDSNKSDQDWKDYNNSCHNIYIVKNAGFSEVREFKSWLIESQCWCADIVLFTADDGAGKTQGKMNAAVRMTRSDSGYSARLMNLHGSRPKHCSFSALKVEIELLRPIVRYKKGRALHVMCLSVKDVDPSVHESFVKSNLPANSFEVVRLASREAGITRFFAVMTSASAFCGLLKNFPPVFLSARPVQSETETVSDPTDGWMNSALGKPGGLLSGHVFGIVGRNKEPSGKIEDTLQPHLRSESRAQIAMEIAATSHSAKHAKSEKVNIDQKIDAYAEVKDNPAGKLSGFDSSGREREDEKVKGHEVTPYSQNDARHMALPSEDCSVENVDMQRLKTIASKAGILIALDIHEISGVTAAAMLGFHDEHGQHWKCLAQCIQRACEKQVITPDLMLHFSRDGVEKKIVRELRKDGIYASFGEGATESLEWHLHRFLRTLRS